MEYGYVVAVGVELGADAYLAAEVNEGVVRVLEDAGPGPGQTQPLVVRQVRQDPRLQRAPGNIDTPPRKSSVNGATILEK